MKIYADGERREYVTLRDVKLGKYAEHVILENKCGSLLEMRVVYESDRTNIYYMTEGLESVESLMRRSVNTDIYRCVSELLRAVSCASEYLVSENELLFDPDHIYMDPDTGLIRMMYVPGGEDVSSIREAIVDIADLWLSVGVRDENEIESVIEYKNNVYYRDHGIKELIRITEEASRKRHSKLDETEGTKVIRGRFGLEGPENERVGDDLIQDGTQPDIKRELLGTLGDKLRDIITELVS